MVAEPRTALQPYLPRLVVDWRARTPAAVHRALDGSLVSVDVSGFTALSERLAGRGKLGAEELIGQISRLYTGLIEVTLRHGGDVLKFRGDALLLWFSGEAHAERACAAALAMQDFVDARGAAETSVGPVTLRMSAGVHAGRSHFFLVGAPHRELIVAGPAATAVFELEGLAAAGEVLVNEAGAAALDPAWLAGGREGARLLRRGVAAETPPPELPELPLDGLEELIPLPLRPLLAGGRAEAEHRQATAAFVKFGGTDALVDDEERAAAALAALAEVVGRTAAELGLTWLESDIDRDGGKLYLLAGAPSSAGGDEERMLRALRAIVDAGAGPPVSAGVNRGPVFAGEIGSPLRRTYAVMGDTVNLAARLAARAKPGQILASRAVLERSQARFEAEPQPFLVKGKQQPIAAFWVGRRIEAPVEETRPTLELVGREAELAALREAVDSARRRQSALVELVGEPGIGKSRLVEELRTLAAGFQQLSARGEEYESATPFRAFRDLLRPLVGITPDQGPEEAGALLVPWVLAVMPDLAPWLPLLAIPFDADVPPTPETDEVDPVFRQRRLHETVEELLQRILLVPTLLVFEDVHWMDDASRFLLRHLTAAPGPRPWLVCATRRPEGEALVREGNGVRLELGPLVREASSELALAALEDWALPAEEFAALVERAGGNPLFVRELVASRAGGARDELPQTVEAVITARVDTLDPTDRLLLRCAAVIGPSFDLDLLAEILTGDLVEAADPARWERLSEFVGRDDGQLRFHHDLFRTVSYEGLSYRRRTELHRRVGAALEQRGGGDESAALLSVHFFAAGDYPRSWAYAVAAGDRARERYANIDAAELYERALGSAEHLDLPELDVARVAEALGDVHELAARYAQAAEAYAHARDASGSDPVSAARLLRKQGVLQERVGDYAAALGLYGRGLQTLWAGGSRGAERVELELETAATLHRQGRFRDCLRWSRRAAAHAEHSGDRRLLARAYRILEAAHRELGDPDSGYIDRALPLYEELGDLVGVATVLNNLGVRAHYAGRWDEALERYRGARDAERRAGDVVRAAVALNNEAELLLEQGRLDEAAEAFEEAIRVGRGARYPLVVAVATANLGRIAARRARFDEADDRLDEAERSLAEIGSEGFAGVVATWRAERLVLEGRHRDAHRLALDTLERTKISGEVGARNVLLERLLGYAEAQDRRPRDAADHLELALALARGLGADYEAALTLKAIADTGVDPGAAAEARELLARLGVVTTPYVPLP